jgi:crotonobetainyl-CoA:carnitine CoA-transferase CaiB-like acyl-CoA transferase
VYACLDGRVAMAALEPHFAKALADVAGVADSGIKGMFKAQSHAAIANYLASQTRKQLDALALAKDIPLHTLK